MEEVKITIPIEYKELFDNWWRECACYGGRYSLKSHTVARFLLIRAREQKTRVGCFREFQNSIAESSHQLLRDLINKYGFNDFEVTDKTIVNKITKSDFLFKGLWHNEQNIKSTEGIDIAWVEEAQTVSQKSLEVLTPTVRKPGSKIIYTYNRLLEEDPVHVRMVIEGRPNSLIINQNYDIAERYGWMPDEIKNEIEDDKKNRPGLYKHKWLGEPISHELKIYKDWKFIEEIPHEARLERRWLDFGYSNDPSAIGEIYYYNGGWIIHELLYQKGMSNKQLADFLNSLDNKQTQVVADSAEPKSIADISRFGITIKGVTKGRDSINYGIDVMQRENYLVTSQSTNLIKELRSYCWDTDKTGKRLNKPIDNFNHAIDAVRYHEMETLGMNKNYGSYSIL